MSESFQRKRTRAVFGGLFSDEPDFSGPSKLQVLVYGGFQACARLELRHGGRGHLDLLARSRVARLAGRPLGDAERAETRERHLVPALESRSYGAHECVDYALGARLASGSPARRWHLRVRLCSFSCSPFLLERCSGGECALMPFLLAETTFNNRNLKYG